VLGASRACILVAEQRTVVVPPYERKYKKKKKKNDGRVLDECGWTHLSESAHPNPFQY
jgi:hypothetical protein